MPASAPRPISILRGPDWSEWKNIPGGRWFARPTLLQKGHILCIGARANEANASLECWSIEGNNIQPHRAYGMKEGAVAGGITGAANSTRVAFLEGSSSYNAFTENTTSRLKGYLVWDVENERVVAELPTKKQDYFYPMDRAPRGGQAPKASFDFALSPDGTLLALGGDDILEIYTLPQ